MNPQMICTNCGLRGNPKTYTRGNTYIKVMTWPLSTFARYQGCPRCGAENMVPIDSPRGQELARVSDAFHAEHSKQPGETYYSEGGTPADVGWFISPPNDGPLLGPFPTKEEAERVDRMRMGITLKPGDEFYYSEGWFVRPLNGPVLGPFSTREEAERAERGEPPSPEVPVLDPIETPAPPGPRFRTREGYEAWKRSQTGEGGNQ